MAHPFCRFCGFAPCECKLGRLARLRGAAPPQSEDEMYPPEHYPEPPDEPPAYRCFDAEAQADLALHDELWPDGYGR